MNQLDEHQTKHESDLDDGPVPVPRVPVVAPSISDDIIRPSSEIAGGPLGKHAYSSWRFWSPLPVLVLFTVSGFILGMIQKLPCTTNGWASPDNFTHLCYSDIPPLYTARGFADHIFPYLQAPLPGQEMLEYPVGTGLFAQLANWLSPQPDAVSFYYTNVLLLFVCLLGAVIATALTVRRRPWDAAMVALAPGTILCATINWDLLSVALTSISMLLWARKYPAWAGVFLGLAAASKFYPILLLGPVFLLCLRAGRMQAFVRYLAGGIIAWAALNLPFMFANFDGWVHFYVFSSQRGEDFGSIWMLLTNAGFGVPAASLNIIALVILAVLCLGIAVMTMTVKRRPRIAQLAFLVMAAFLLTNKVYSPQYVLWLIPLAALARPNWRDFLIWQVGEAIYFVGIWWYIVSIVGDHDKSLPVGWYCFIIVIHLAATLYFAIMIIRDICWPEYDPIRTDQWEEDRDDPGGGVLDGAEDRFVIGKRRSADETAVEEQPGPIAQ